MIYVIVLFDSLRLTCISINELLNVHVYTQYGIRICYYTWKCLQINYLYDKNYILSDICTFRTIQNYTKVYILTKKRSREISIYMINQTH